jgi:hypothetical protein
LFSTDADFRSWGSTISAMIAALGMVQTADTGQINWTTVLKPASTSTYQGYEIWRFADALQSTTPVFFKLEYGSSSTGICAALAITVGSASNGAGTLLGQVTTRAVFAAGAGKGAGVTIPTYASGGTGELYLATNLDLSTTSYGLLLALFRPKDGSGADTGDGVVAIIMGSSGPTVNHSFVPQTGTVTAATTQFPVIHPGFNNRPATGSTGSMSPLVEPINGVWRNTKFIVINNTDFGAGGTVTATMLGGTHTFVIVGAACNGASSAWATAGSGPAASAGIAIPWE